MKRWLLWYLLAPQAWLLAGLWRDAGLPPFDPAVFACLFLGFFAERAAVPMLLFGCAIGRTLVDEASLPVHLLVLGVPVAVLLPLRSVFFAQRWLALVVAAAACALFVPKLSGLCGRVFDQPSAGAHFEWSMVLWSALLLPVLVRVAVCLPPLRSFEEPA